MRRRGKILERSIENIVKEIREKHGLPNSPFRINEIRISQGKLYIIVRDRTDKSVVIGNSLVVGKLQQKLGVKRITVYSELDLEIKRKKLEEAKKLIGKTDLQFLMPIIEAEKRFPPRKWPRIQGNVQTLVFLSFFAKPLLGFTERTGLPYMALGLKYTFPKLEYRTVDGVPRELFYPNVNRLYSLAREIGAELVLSDFPFPLKRRKNVYFLNPFRLFHMGFFEMKYFFGFEFPTFVDEEALLQFVAELTYEGLMESTDGAKIIWHYWRRRR